MSEETGNEQNTGLSPPKILGVFALAMINIAAVLSIRNYPCIFAGKGKRLARYGSGT